MILSRGEVSGDSEQKGTPSNHFKFYRSSLEVWIVEMIFKCGWGGRIESWEPETIIAIGMVQGMLKMVIII